MCKKVSTGDGKVLAVLRKWSDCVRKVSEGVMKVLAGFRMLSDGVRKVSHGVSLEPGRFNMKSRWGQLVSGKRGEGVRWGEM